jgi:Pao retrotransposon peptidase
MEVVFPRASLVNFGVETPQLFASAIRVEHERDSTKSEDKVGQYKPKCHAQLDTFCDASEEGICCAVYLQVQIGQQTSLIVGCKGQGLTSLS